MGRGIAYFEEASVLFHPFEDWDEQRAENPELPEYPDSDDYQFLQEDLQSFFVEACKGMPADEWTRGDLHIIAKNERLKVAIMYEDTFYMIVIIPGTYTRYMKEEKAENKGFDYDGYAYINTKMDCIVSAIVPYKIEREARRLLRQFVKAFGNINARKGFFSNISTRTSAWTSCPIKLDAFTENRTA